MCSKPHQHLSKTYLHFTHKSDKSRKNDRKQFTKIFSKLNNCMNDLIWNLALYCKNNLIINREIQPFTLKLHSLCPMLNNLHKFIWLVFNEWGSMHESFCDCIQAHEYLMRRALRAFLIGCVLWNMLIFFWRIVSQTGAGLMLGSKDVNPNSTWQVWNVA